MINYDDINSYNISGNFYLFFDIFLKDNELILICPTYISDFDETKIKIKHNNDYLILKTKEKDIDNPVYILNYELQSEKKYEILYVEYMNESKRFILENYKTNKNNEKKLAQTTLFKNDYKLIDIFYKYYINQGVEYFFMYYNDKINDQIKELYKKNNIKLIEWNFVYWNPNPKLIHHAQPCQIQHALYKYGKNEYTYMIFNDLDEYMHIKNKKLIDIINESNYDSIQFYNFWSQTLDNNIPEEIPQQIIINNVPNGYPHRMKCINKTNSIRFNGIHYPDKYTKENPEIYHTHENMLLHFYNWTKNGRKEEVNTIYNLI